MNKLVSGLSALWGWVDERLPVQRTWDVHMAKYYAPKNFNLWYYFGVLSLVVLVIQLLSGIWLLMFYEGTIDGAFTSVEYIMRDVHWGSYIRYMHSTGASAFFIVVYLHMFRALLYGSYRKPRELLWIIGMTIYLALMAEAFLGYVLPWGQMSFWGAQVIINLFGALPLGLGDPIVEWIRSDYLISGATLNKFMSLHAVAVPIILIILVFVHILALHEVGSNNPDGIEIKQNKDENGIPKDGIPFYPYYLPLHDLMPICIFLFVFCTIMFFFPEMGGYFLEHANFEQANPLKTPEHIAPVWYFTPFYSMLRAVTFDVGFITAKLGGFIAMGGAIAILFVLPWLDKAPVKSIRYKGKLTILLLLLFVAFFVILGVLGVKSPTASRTLLAQVGTVFYFAYFVAMPAWSDPGASAFVKRLLCWPFALAFLGLTFFDMTLLIPYGTADYMGVLVEHPNYIVGIITIALAILFFKLPDWSNKETYKRPPERVTMDNGLGFAGLIKGLIVVAILSVVPLMVVGAESEFECGEIPCETFEINSKDKASLQRGAKWYMNYCVGCHSTKYSRYERVANDLGIDHQVMLDNLVFGDEKIGDLMTTSMNKDQGKAWFGAPPPDLTLITRARSPEWVYTYLKNFYADNSRPLGVNNRVFKNVGMPHVLMELQGLSRCQPGPVQAANGGLKRDPLTRELILEGECGILSVAEEDAGSMSAEEFDQVAYDITNYLEYLSDPGKDKRHYLGFYVLLFIVILFVLVWLLNREYWRDIH